MTAGKTSWNKNGFGAVERGCGFNAERVGTGRCRRMNGKTTRILRRRLRPGATLGRLFIRTAVLHLAEHTFTLQLLFQNAQRLFNIVVSYGYVHGESLPLEWLAII